MERIIAPQVAVGIVLKILKLVLNIAFGKRLLLLLSLVAVGGILFSVSSTSRNWAVDRLGYGFAPVVLWLFLVLVCSLYNWKRLFHNWRLWLASGGLVLAVIAVLSLMPITSRLPNEKGMGGTWGEVLGGAPIYLGSFKVVGLLLLVSVVTMPHKTATTLKIALAASISVTIVAIRWSSTLVWLSTVTFFKVSRSVLRRLILVGGHNREALSNRLPALEMLDSEVENDVVESGAGTPRRSSSSRKGRKGLKEPKEGIQWPLPLFDLIKTNDVKQVPEDAMIKEMSERIRDVLGEHSVEVEVKSVRAGPRIIRFGLSPGWVRRHRERRDGNIDDSVTKDVGRVRVQSILAREKDLALALKTHSIRMEAPVPGEAVVGLEVPNPHPSNVSLRSVVDSNAFQSLVAKGGLPVAIGEDIGGAAVVADLKDLPHLLIAGATGSGKSVCLNAVIGSLLLVKKPDELRFVLIDPKRVELTPFNGIPHLALPVVVNTDQVLNVLNGMMREMFRRYMLMEEQGVRNIEGYNAQTSLPLPYYVLVIDELADLMMAAGDVEQSLVRLGQLGRATGIHLVLATQRPSVNVVTGLLKANIPCRIAFAVASQVDSRVILDSAGAEKLLGRGDMLLLTQESPRPRRVQGTYVSENELQKVVKYWRTRTGPPVEPLVVEGDDVEKESDEESDGQTLDAARKLAKSYNRISPSTLQRRLQIGYARALQMIQMLEDEGVLAPGEIGKSRQTIGSKGP